MTAKIIDFKPHLNKKIEKQLEKEAEIIFEGEGIMDGVEFMSYLKDEGVQVFVVMDDEIEMDNDNE